ncbi:MAG: serine hydrolase domain-containing protein, partial [Burkholderiaceae bacterium]
MNLFHIHRRALLRALLLPLALCAGMASAQPLPSAKPEEVGLSAERLARVGQWLQAEIDAKRVPGTVVMVVRQGKVAYLDVRGRQDPATSAPMSRDSIFRIYSMTKPLVSVATMMMVEEG